MYANRHLRWNTASSGYYLQPKTVTVVEKDHNVSLGWAVVVVLMLVLSFLGTNKLVRIIATSNVVYQPTVITQAQATPGIEFSDTPKEVPPSPQPAVAPIPTPDKSEKIQSILNAWEKNHKSKQWSVVVSGLGKNKTKASVNSSYLFGTASLYKLYIMYPLFQTYSLDEMANTHLKVEGKGSITLKDCVDLMIKNSDNPCGVAAGYLAGWGRSSDMLKQLGMNNTNLNSLGGEISTTAADASLFLQKLEAGKLMKKDEQKYLINLMQNQQYRSGIPAGCSECKVADKIGDKKSIRHDVAIVKYSGGSYVLTILTNGASYGEMAELTSQIQNAMTAKR